MALLPAVVRIVKDGIFTMLKGADIICAAAPFAVEVIQKKWPTNEGLLNAAKGVQAACQIFRLEARAQKDVDTTASRPPGVVTPGVPTEPPVDPEP